MYYVMPWDDGQEETKVLVSFSQYQNAEVGEDAYIYQKQGFLRMEWYHIEIR